MRQPIVGDEADWAQRTNLVSVRGGSDSGRVIPTANQMKTAMVDVSGQEPETIFVKKTASINALGKYPLDSYADVRAAVDYFNDNWTQFSPEDRREFCKVAGARAQDIGIGVPDLMARYGSSSYAPDVEAHLSSRKAIAPMYREVYDTMLEKMSEIEPEVFAELLKQADTAANLNWHWGSHIADPWFSTFGGVGQEKVAFAWESHDGKSVDELGLQELAASGALSSAFDKDFVASFAKDPVSIFESMPDDAKRIIADIAGDKQKISGAMSHAAEIAGLGILGKPSLDRLRGKHVDEKSSAKKEIGGLGLLAVPSAAHLGSDAVKKIAPKFHARTAATSVGKFLAKHGSVEKTGGGFDRAAALAGGKVIPKAVKQQNMTALLKNLGH